MNDTDVTARLAEALAEAWSGKSRPRWTPDGTLLDFAPTAAALLPVVREIADQRAAEELERIAEWAMLASPTFPYWQISKRAAALRGEAGR